MAYLDQFLASGKATHAIQNRKEYQLAAMTALYLAIKLCERIEMSTSIFSALSRDAYQPEDFARMENEMLSALNWRLNGPTVLCFLEHFWGLFPNVRSKGDIGWTKLLHYSRHYAELTLGDYNFAVLNPSTVAICCISAAMKRIPSLLPESESRNYFLKISSTSKIDLSSCHIKDTKRRLMSIIQKTPQVELNVQLSILSECNGDSTMQSSTVSGSSSPVCISREEGNNYKQI